ncbi:MAG: aspartate--tRNA ligase [Clostridiales bacterium]|nr:aspartate--tRNA ligase [Clostridiales bacterium]
MNMPFKRTHMCAEVAEELVGQTVSVCGWVGKRRSLGQVVFVTVRDRSGLVQIVADEGRVSPETARAAASVRSEFVVAVRGRVLARASENVNPDMTTGKIEIEAEEFVILSEADVPPFQVAETGVKEDLRGRYRYIDLRRPELAGNIITRHKITAAARSFLNKEGFLDIETPYLTKSTPEGARDYLVPSRVHKGSFYALPQSPQQLKQLLMISGFDRYYQIARCFRDEDLRADRQPEFTQIDMELSFVDMEDVISLNDRFMAHLAKEILGREVAAPFPRLTYKEAMERFGSDKPDIRFGMELVDLSGEDIVKNSGFAVFTGALEAGGSVRAIAAPGCAELPRKQVDALIEVARTYRAKGLVWIALLPDGSVKSSIGKFFDESAVRALAEKAGAKTGDLALVAADRNEVVFDALGNLRLHLAEKLNLADKSDFAFLWVTDFPLFEWNEEDGRFYAKHHPFTAPLDEDLPLFDTNPAGMRAQAYDMVLNGYELGGGSIRIHRGDVQEKMFKTLGFSFDEARAQFGYFLEAFRYGAPPHGGLAFGLDRICMLFTGASAIRDVIAFPKVKDASCPLTSAPGGVSAKQLEELGYSNFTKR